MMSFNEAVNMADQILNRFHEMTFENDNNEWVSVEDELPERGERVIATDGTFVGEAYMTITNKWFRYDGCSFDRDIEELLETKITHWMPMPSAPKKEKKDE